MGGDFQKLENSYRQVNFPGVFQRSHQRLKNIFEKVLYQIKITMNLKTAYYFN